MKKGLLALAATAMALGPAGPAHAYEEAIDVNDTGIVCLDFSTGHRVDEDAVFEEWDGQMVMVSTSCPENHQHVQEGWCLPDFPWESEEQRQYSRCDEIPG